jgi:hypothetical protein
MITTSLYSLAYLFAHSGTAVSDADVRAFAGMPADFDAAIVDLVAQGAVTASAGTGGNMLQISATETGATLTARAQAAGLTAEEMWAFEEVVATAAITPANPFRDAAVAAGLGANDARLAGGSARLLALVRKRRTGSGDLIPSSIRAGSVSDLAATSLG